MGYIKEPDGVDFVINGKTLTHKQKQAVSEFIKADKERMANLKYRRTKSAKRRHNIGAIPAERK